MCYAFNTTSACSCAEWMFACHLHRFNVPSALWVKVTFFLRAREHLSAQKEFNLFGCQTVKEKQINWMLFSFFFASFQHTLASFHPNESGFNVSFRVVGAAVVAVFATINNVLICRLIDLYFSSTTMKNKHRIHNYITDQLTTQHKHFHFSSWISFLIT